MFIDNAINDPAYYVTVVCVVTLSIVLHELGHGLAAIQQGDDTPMRTGHITLNPLVHMGTMGLGLLVVAGIAFGVMPVDPSRFRSRHGDALVAAAGPLVNLALALVALTGLALLLANGIDPRIFGVDVLRIMGILNFVLFIFNLIPVAPLDGSAVLASFSPAYRRVIRSPEAGRYVWILFGVVFFMSGRLFAFAASIANGYVEWLVGS